MKMKQMIFAFAGMWIILSVLCLGLAKGDEPITLTESDWDSLSYTPFKTMQGVDGSGGSTWSVPLQDGWSTYAPDYPQAYKLRGVVLNDPAKMLDTTANYLEGPMWEMGGQWQVYIQTTETNPQVDFGGSALWIGQNYGNHYWHWQDWSYNYTNEEWDDEVERLNYPIYESTGQLVTEPLRPGDLIEVRARGGLAYNGKFNCNEQHTNEMVRDFQIIVLDRDVAVDPVAITLADVQNTDSSFIFDSSRTTGAEFYQAQYVTLEGVTISDATGWGTYGDITVTDGVREFSVKLGYNTAFDSAALPSGTLNITGIFDQESDVLTSGYRMWATSPADFVPATTLIPGDANGDNVVDELDASDLSDHWECLEDVSWFDGDFNRDGRVDATDASILAANWGASSAEQVPTPEPTCLVLWLTMLTIAISSRNRRSGCA